MASHKSAVKEMRGSRRRRDRNRAHRSALRTGLKKIRGAIKPGDDAAREGLVREASSMLDRKASKKVIHRNAAARIKSRIARQANKAK